MKDSAKLSIPKVDSELHQLTVFEPVNATYRPAHSKMRSKGLQWKGSVDEVPEKGAGASHSAEGLRPLRLDAVNDAKPKTPSPVSNAEQYFEVPQQKLEHSSHLSESENSTWKELGIAATKFVIDESIIWTIVLILLIHRNLIQKKNNIKA